MDLRRGFKAEATRIASDLRKEMGISEVALFDPFAAAENLGIDVFPFSKCMEDANPEHEALLRSGRLSAMTIFFNKYKRAFVIDDYRTPERIASDLAHEIAHAVLLHPSHGATDIDHGKAFGGTAEAEASHLSGVFLVSDSAALDVVSRSIDLGAASAKYGVSREMMNWRINASGARKIVARRRVRRDSQLSYN